MTRELTAIAVGSASPEQYEPTQYVIAYMWINKALLQRKQADSQLVLLPISGQN